MMHREHTHTYVYDPIVYLYAASHHDITRYQQFQYVLLALISVCYIIQELD